MYIHVLPRVLLQRQHSELKATTVHCFPDPHPNPYPKPSHWTARTVAIVLSHCQEGLSSRRSSLFCPQSLAVPTQLPVSDLLLWQKWLKPGDKPSMATRGRREMVHLPHRIQNRQTLSVDEISCWLPYDGQQWLTCPLPLLQVRAQLWFLQRTGPIEV